MCYIVIFKVPFTWWKTQQFHSKNKHIDLRYHWNQHVLEEGQLSLEKIHKDKNHVDMLTMILLINKHKLCRGMVGLAVTWSTILHSASSGRIMWIQTKTPTLTLTITSISYHTDCRQQSIVHWLLISLCNYEKNIQRIREICPSSKNMYFDSAWAIQARKGL